MWAINLAANRRVALAFSEKSRESFVPRGVLDVQRRRARTAKSCLEAYTYTWTQTITKRYESSRVIWHPCSQRALGLCVYGSSMERILWPTKSTKKYQSGFVFSAVETWRRYGVGLVLGRWLTSPGEPAPRGHYMLLRWLVDARSALPQEFMRRVQTLCVLLRFFFVYTNIYVCVLCTHGHYIARTAPFRLLIFIDWARAPFCSLPWTGSSHHEPRFRHTGCGWRRSWINIACGYYFFRDSFCSICPWQQIGINVDLGTLIFNCNKEQHVFNTKFLAYIYICCGVTPPVAAN